MLELELMLREEGGMVSVGTKTTGSERGETVCIGTKTTGSEWGEMVFVGTKLRAL